MAKTEDKCCQNQDLIHDNWMNVCRQRGQVINHDFATIVIKVIEKLAFMSWRPVKPLKGRSGLFKPKKGRTGII